MPQDMRPQPFRTSSSLSQFPLCGLRAMLFP